MDALPLNDANSFHLILNSIQAGRVAPLSVLPNTIKCTSYIHI